MSAYDAFAPIYDAWYPMTEDVPFYVGLAEEAEGPVVELAVGTGRVAIPVAEQTGKHILGIDSSPAMLEVARERTEEAGVDVELREGDMRDFELYEPAALVYCPARSLLHLPTWADRRRVFERVAAALKPGGRFAWNAFVFDHQLAGKVEGGWQEHPMRHRIAYAPPDNRVDIDIENGPTLSLWWITRGEWEGLLDVAGLETEALYGWFDRRPFDESSREFVWVARKRA
ncbi:MAG TPA: class I SAM-dependent methyltransferase [Gaiellaceae bacterium]|nr:class I SAM-dependent methyltransferase [Gaiellaceae bacterium]